MLIDGAAEVFAFGDDGEGGNVILYALFVSFLFKAEGIAKSIFQLDSRNGLMPDMAAGGAAALAFGKQAVGGVKGLVSKNESKHDEEDKKEEKGYTNKRRELESSRSASSVRENERKMEESSRKMDKASKESKGGTGAGEKTDNGAPVLTPDNINAGANENAKPGANGEGADQGAGNQPEYSDEYIADNLEKAKDVMAEKAMKSRNGSFDFKRQKGFKGVMGNIAKNAGKAGIKTIRGVAGFGVKAGAYGVGLAAGAASGSLTKGLEYGTALSKTAGLATSAIGRGASWYGRQFKSENLRSKIEEKDKNLMKDLQDAGVDTDALFNSKKGDLIKKALAEYTSGMVRGGKTLADKEFTNTILSESLDKSEETSTK